MFSRKTFLFSIFSYLLLSKACMVNIATVCLSPFCSVQVGTASKGGSGSENTAENLQKKNEGKTQNNLFLLVHVMECFFFEGVLVPLHCCQF